MKIQLLLKLDKGLILMIAANILMLFGTWLQHYSFYYILDGDWSQASKVEYLILQFSLASENNIATWYSSTLFFLVALMSLFCFLVQKNLKKNNKYLSFGWLIFFLIFAVLSYDEIASMHERIGNINALNPFSDEPPGWIILLTTPIIFIGGFMLWFCWIQIKKAPYAVIFAAIGILLFLSIPAQELLETEAWLNSADPDSWMRPVHFLLLEEGSEIFGATFILISTVLFAHSAIRPNKNFSLSNKLKLKIHLNRANFFRWFTAILLFLGLIMIVVNRSTLLAAEGDIGISRNWFPSVTAFLAALLSLFIFYKRKKSGQVNRSIFLYLALFCLFLSCYYGSYIYVYLGTLEGEMIQTILLFFFWIITLKLGVILFLNMKNSLRKAGVVLWTVMTIIVLGIYNEYSAVLAYIAFSLLILTQLSLIFNQKTVLDIPGH